MNACNPSTTGAMPATTWSQLDEIASVLSDCEAFLAALALMGNGLGREDREAFVAVTNVTVDKLAEAHERLEHMMDAARAGEASK